MKTRRRPKLWTIIYIALLVIGLAIFTLNLTINQDRHVIPSGMVRVLETLFLVGFILKAGEPVKQLVDRAISLRTDLPNSARIGLGISILAGLVLMLTVPAVFLIDWFYLALPAITSLYCVGVFLAQRSSLLTGSARYRRLDFGWSLYWSLLGVTILDPGSHVPMQSWASVIVGVYFIVIVPLAGAMILVSEGKPRTPSHV